MKPRNICPATAGIPTRLSRESWDRLCKAYQRKARGYYRGINDLRSPGLCRTCKGKTVPDEVEFTDFKLGMVVK
jgi:hypothetical protein